MMIFYQNKNLSWNKSEKIHFKFFHNWNFTPFWCPDNQISLCFGVPNNRISLHLDVLNNQISLHLDVPDNCSRWPRPGWEQRLCGLYRRNSRLAQETGQNTEHQTEFQGRWIGRSKIRGMDWARASSAALGDFSMAKPHVKSCPHRLFNLDEHLNMHNSLKCN